MAKSSNESEFTTLFVKKGVPERVDILKELVSIEKGVNVNGYDSIAFGINLAIDTLQVKHKLKKR
jgi:hypothetical protein